MTSQRRDLRPETEEVCPGLSAGTWPGRGDPVPWEREIDEAQCGDNWKDARLGDLGTSPRTLTEPRPALFQLYLETESQALALHRRQTLWS